MTFVKEFRIGATTKRTKEELKNAKEIIEKLRDEDSKMVKGVFKNIEVPSGDLTFTYRKYKEDNHRTYHFEDGKTYTIPLGVAKHINNGTKVKQHSHVVDAAGKHIPGLAKPRERYQFLSTEFM